ncbi:hypothetical protein [Janibacter melonis]|uniref:hypothetical protein n=1 Tax=Janibacter melonis TaxID=262209 RepID=UPI002095EA9D|nr:hypothetical protein [Janibacter melonis]
MHVRVALAELVTAVPGEEGAWVLDVTRLDGADDGVEAALGELDLHTQPVDRHDGVGVGRGEPQRVVGHPAARDRASTHRAPAARPRPPGRGR